MTGLQYAETIFVVGVRESFGLFVFIRPKGLGTVYTHAAADAGALIRVCSQWQIPPCLIDWTATA